ncbi:unnamed protein product, partial [Didymodactylos carnosus]
MVSMLLADYRAKHPQLKISERNKKLTRLDPGTPFTVWKSDKLQIFGDAHLIHDEIF